MDFIHWIDYDDDVDDDTKRCICLIISSVCIVVEWKLHKQIVKYMKAFANTDCRKGAFVKPQFIIVF